MDVLTNTDIAEVSDLNNENSYGLTPIAFPKVENSNIGVSVEYVPDVSGTKRWHLFRASYGRSDKATDYLISKGVYVYTPKHIKTVIVNDKRKEVLCNLLPNLVFAYISTETAKQLVSTETTGILSLYYDHCQQDKYGKNPPLVISNEQMRSFALMANTLNPNIICLDGKEFTYKSNDKVEVIYGEFKGVKGTVIRASRQQRVLVELSDFMKFATAYIPSSFLQKVEE